jgi:hypothetical protein
VKLEGTYRCEGSPLSFVALGEYDPVHERLYLIKYVANETFPVNPSGSWIQKE